MSAACGQAVAIFSLWLNRITDRLIVCICSLTSIVELLRDLVGNRPSYLLETSHITRNSVEKQRQVKQAHGTPHSSAQACFHHFSRIFPTSQHKMLVSPSCSSNTVLTPSKKKPSTEITRSRAFMKQQFHGWFPNQNRGNAVFGGVVHATTSQTIDMKLLFTPKPPSSTPVSWVFRHAA